MHTHRHTDTVWVIVLVVVMVMVLLIGDRVCAKLQINLKSSSRFCSRVKEGLLYKGAHTHTIG